MERFITNCRVIDCTSNSMKPYQATVVIKDGKIQNIDRSEGLKAGPDSVVTDLSGGFILPGLWDVHCHPGAMSPDPNRGGYFETEAEVTLRAVRNTSAALYKGVTALRAVAEANYIDVALRETFAGNHPPGLWREGYVDKPLVGPRIFCSGPAIRMTGGHASDGRIDSQYISRVIEADGPDEVRKAVRQCIKLGVDWIKLLITGGIAGIRESMYEIQFTYDEIKAACDVAHNKGLKVCAHTGSSEAAKIGVKAGLDCIEHGYELDDEACDLMAANGVYYCPTISVTQDEAYMRRWEWPEHSIGRALSGAELHRKALGRAVKAGVTLVNGADENPIADTAVNEIEWVVKSGVSPEQALLAATRNPAEMCGVLDSLGTIEVGKIADIIVTNENPLQDISALHDIAMVMKEGNIIIEHPRE